MTEISVVVRARNEEKTIADTLSSIRSQVLPDKGFRVSTIVVNNGSNDRTVELVEEFIARRQSPNFSFLLVTEDRIGRGRALQTGVERATTEWVAILDADSIANPNWILNITEYIFNHPDYIAGSGRIRFRNGPFHHRLLYDFGRQVIFAAASRRGEGWMSLSNSWFRREAFFEAGGTADLPADTITDDRILALRLRKIGRMGFNAKATIETDNWLSQKPLWVSNLPVELEQVRLFSGVSNESLLHTVIRGCIAPVCRRWDAVKQIKLLM